MNFQKYMALAILASPLMLLSTACTPAQENTVLTDIEGVVSLAGSVLSVVQSFGALNSPSEQKDIVTAEDLAQQYSAAASQAITEFNSTDGWNVKVERITALFLTVTPLSPIADGKINAAVDLMTAAVKLLLAQLSNTAATPAPGFQKSHFRDQSFLDLKSETKSVPTLFAGLLPGTLHYKLRAIQKKADATVALAGRLKAAARLR